MKPYPAESSGAVVKIYDFNETSTLVSGYSGHGLNPVQEKNLAGGNAIYNRNAYKSKDFFTKTCHVEGSKDQGSFFISISISIIH